MTSANPGRPSWLGHLNAGSRPFIVWHGDLLWFPCRFGLQILGLSNELFNMFFNSWFNSWRHQGIQIDSRSIILYPFKMLKLTSLTDSLDRHSRRRQLLSSSMMEEYLYGQSQLYYLILPTTFSTTIQPTYHRSSELHSRITLFTVTSLIGRQFLPGILDLGNPSISIFYVSIRNLIGSSWSSNLTWVMPIFIS